MKQHPKIFAIPQDDRTLTIIVRTLPKVQRGPDCLRHRSGVGASLLAFSVAVQVCGGVQEAWVQRHTGPASSHYSARAVAWGHNSDLVVIGSTVDPSDLHESCLVSYAANDGALRWDKRFSLPNNDLGFSAAVDGKGDIVTTRLGVTNGNSFTALAKYAALDGAMIWERSASISYSEWNSRFLAMDSAANILLTGANMFLSVAKYAGADGSFVWEAEESSSWQGNTRPTVVLVNSRDDVLIVGTEWGFDIPKGFLARYAMDDGALLWERRPSIEWLADVTSATLDANGNLVVAGMTIKTNNWASEHFIAKFAGANGQLLWDQRDPIPAAGYNRDTTVAVDSAGDVIVSKSVYGTNDWDYCTLKYAGADGRLLWEQRYDGPAHGEDQARAVAVDNLGNVAVTGNSVNGRGDTDIYTAKYSGADGTMQWEQRYDGPAHGDDRVELGPILALGPDGRVAVVGSSQRNSTASDLVTIMYREVLFPVSLRAIAPGMVIRFAGIPGHTYAIERALAVTGPWTRVAIVVAPPSGPVDNVDTAPPARAAFYRTRTP